MADDECPEPDSVAALRDRAGPERWETIVAKARRQAAVVAAVEAAVASGLSLTKAVRLHGGGMTRSGFMHLRRRVKNRSGDLATQLVDRRVPPTAPPTPRAPTRRPRPNATTASRVPVATPARTANACSRA